MKAKLQRVINGIEHKSNEFSLRATKHIEQLTMPRWALGRLLDLAVDICAMTRSLSPQVRRKVIFVLAADHGITIEGVSLYPKEVTAQMVGNFATGGAGVNVLARHAGAQTVIVDLGVDGDLSRWVESGKVVNCKVALGTQNFLHAPAMSESEMYQAIDHGLDLAEQYQENVDLFATGDMGIGNTTASAAIVAVLTQRPVETLVGRGTGIGDAMLFHKIKVIEEALALHQPKSPLEALQKLGGFEIAGLVGLILGAAFRKKPILIDGYISTASALVAAQLCPVSLDYMIASHASAENGHRLMWEELKKAPLLDLGLRLGEGTGTALAMHLVEASCRIFNEMNTFAGAQVSTVREP